MASVKPAKAQPANALWGGRFDGGPAAIMRRINASIEFDRRLWAEDIAGSEAHCAMLVAQRIISPEDGEAIIEGLGQIRREIETGAFVFRDEHEDIHLNIEARLAELIGPVAGRLHTARSRNDQVATDFRLWVRGAIDRIDAAMRELQVALLDQAEAHAEAVMPGFTHLQIAQPVTFGHHLLAYVEMLGRDRARLAELIGPAAGRLHTARSRNDQVATDFRLWVRNAIDRVDAGLRELQSALIDQAEAYADCVMPGFTHLQIAQPVTLGHHLMAYVEMLGRDRGRFADCRRRLNESPLGAAALAGTAFPIDRDLTAAALGFDRPAANSIDAVSDRDFAVEFLAAAALAGTHLSRFAEEIVIWSTDAFGFVRLSDAFTTGSSIMPQKRNPDAAELVRAKTGLFNGALIALLTVMKGLPLAYQKDMQEDKVPVFEAADALGLCLAATTGLVRDMHPDRERLRDAAARGFSTATDLADWLVRALGLPFRRAHHITGEIVRRAELRGCSLAELPLSELQAVEPAITDAVYDVLDVERSVASRASFGGTAPAQVRQAIAAARRKYLA